MVSAESIGVLAADISRPDALISTLVRPETDAAEMANPNRVKAVLDRFGNALYFSRSPLPYYRSGGSEWLAHVGMYAFRREILEQITALPPGRLEMAESLEQLRWLENGFPIHCCETAYRGFGIDTPADLEKMIESGLI
jgi:3-deoxy-manno-octulosonate cytidylyltransferase (CMP-KDO synthetase)